jgi:WD40 repeat protein/serine/threonine protein kinase
MSLSDQSSYDRFTLGSGAAAAEPVGPPPVIPDYELLQRIGRGSYGEVWLARNALGSLRAVKIVYRRSFDHDKPYEREFAGLKSFEPVSHARESQIDVFHVGRNDKAGFFYYIMELADRAEPRPSERNPFLPNRELAPSELETLSPKSEVEPEAPDAAPYEPRTLKHELCRRGALPVAECIQLALSLTRALEHLHHHRLVHRDIKPSNIIFVNGVPKLADIGLVTSVDSTRSFVGTDGYIPPEGPGTPEADLYGLGKVLYECVTGKDRLDFPELPADWRPRADLVQLLEFNEVIVKACESDPHHRYQSAKEMEADLALLQSGRSVRHLHAVERRVAILTKTSLVTAVLLAIAAGGFIYQHSQTRQVERAKQTTEQLLYASDMSLAGQMIESGSLIRAKVLLAAHRPQKGTADLPGFEWYYLNYLLRDDRSITFRGHTGGVRGVAISPDGKTLASCSADQTIKLWDMATHKVVATLTGHRGSVDAIAFSPDGKSLASGSADSTLRLWNVETRQLMASLTNHTKAVSALAFAPNGNLLASGSADQTVRLWDVITKQEIKTFARHTDRVTAVSFSPDGERLASSSRDNTVKVWDLERGEMLSLYDKAGWIFSGAFSPDGQVFGATRTDGIVFWNLAEKRVLGALTGHSRTVRSLVFSADGKTLATASEDTTVKLWNFATKQVIATFKGHTGIVTSVLFSPDAKSLVSGSDDGTVKLWDRSGKNETDVLRGHADWAYAVAFSPNDRTLASGSGDGTIKLWEVASGTNLFTLTGHADGVTGVAFLPDGETLVSCGLDRTLRLWNTKTRQQTGILAGHTKRIQCFALSPNGRTLVSGTGWWDDLDTPGELIVWDLSSQRKVAVLPTHPAMITDIKFSPDGNAFATADVRGTTKLWDTGSFQTKATFINHGSPMAFSPDGKTLALEEPGRLIGLWDIASHRLTTTIQSEGDIGSLVYSPDGKTLAATSHANSIVTLCDVASGREVATLHGHERMCLGMAFSHDGQTLASASNDNTVRLWRAPRSENEAGLEARK